MKKYAISFDNKTVYVIPLARVPHSPGEILPYVREGVCVALYPSACLELEAKCYVDGRETRDCLLVSFAVCYFLMGIRGLPRGCAEVEYGGAPLCPSEYDGENREITARLGDCQLLFTKTAVFEDKIGLKTHIFDSYGRIAVLRVNDCYTFDEAKMREIPTRLAIGGASVVLAHYDGRLCIRSLGGAMAYSAIPAAFSLLSEYILGEGTEETEVSVDGFSARLCGLGDGRGRLAVRARLLGVLEC